MRLAGGRDMLGESIEIQNAYRLGEKCDLETERYR